MFLFSLHDRFLFKKDSPERNLRVSNNETIEITGFNCQNACGDSSRFS